jgi:steroid delta-isomerase-like uncharacterized protein
MIDTTELRQRRERTVRAHVDAENRQDVDGIVATFSATNAAYDIPAFGEGGQPRGPEEIRAMWSGLVTVFPDIHHDILRLRHGDDHVLVEFTVTGTQKADWAGIPAGDRTFSIRVAAVYEFDGEDLICERTYTDIAEMVRQLSTDS